MKTTTLSLLAFAFSISYYSYSQQDYITSLDVCLNPKSQELESRSMKWTEDESARTLTTSTFYSEEGHVKIRNSSRPINYYNYKGELVPINPELKLLGENEYAALDQPFPTFFHSEGSFSVSVSEKGDLMTIGNSTLINGSPCSPKYSFDSNNAEFTDLINGVNKTITFRENGAKYNYILFDQPATSGGTLSITEEVQIPEGYTISIDKTRGKETDFGWSGLLIIKDQKGNIAGTFHEPLCFDQNRQFMIAGYKLTKKNGIQYVSIEIPENWLNDSERAYPVIIDPIVQGPTTTWTGGQMPSCFIPAYNQDSIEVFIPADITVTELNVTASFYADPFTGAWMQDGSMYFSTDCDNSQTFTITGAPGQSAGTAYLDYFNLFNPLTCCFPETCAIQSFWLSYHLGRNLWGSGCNTTYIRYDPVTTSWPYEAVVVGHTAEHISAEWNVPPSPTCTNDCELNGIAYVAYGVPPYTFTHPWSNDTIIQGVNNGCGNGSTTYNFTLTNPNCPIYCDTVTTSLTVPPPVIWDACGNSVSPAQSDDLPLKPAPGFNPVYDTLVCSGTPFIIDLDMCPSTASMSWEGNGAVAWNDTIAQTITNTSNAITMVNYTAYAILNGCYSDTIDVPIYIHPSPIPAYTTNPDPIISGVEVTFNDQSIFNVSPADYWSYDFGDGNTSSDPNPTNLYPAPGEYYVCLTVANQAGCVDSICQMLPVAPAEVHIPNVVTANNDGVNDLLEFQYLEFYPDNHLTVLNRWGNVIYEADNYQNDWNPKDLSEGTYFLILQLHAIETEYSGFFQVIK